MISRAGVCALHLGPMDVAAQGISGGLGGPVLAAVVAEPLKEAKFPPPLAETAAGLPQATGGAPVGCGRAKGIG